MNTCLCKEGLKKEVITILVPSEEIDFLNKILSIEEGYYEGAGHNDTIATYTAKFSNGYEADIKVCNGDTPFIDPVLFNSNGYQLQVLDCEDTLEGEYCFEVDGKEYIVNIERIRLFRFEP